VIAYSDLPSGFELLLLRFRHSGIQVVCFRSSSIESERESLLSIITVLSSSSSSSSSSKRSHRVILDISYTYHQSDHSLSSHQRAMFLPSRLVPFSSPIMHYLVFAYITTGTLADKSAICVLSVDRYPLDGTERLLSEWLAKLYLDNSLESVYQSQVSLILTRRISLYVACQPKYKECKADSSVQDSHLLPCWLDWLGKFRCCTTSRAFLLRQTDFCSHASMQWTIPKPAPVFHTRY